MRFIQMNDELFDYVTDAANPSEHPVADWLAEVTRERFGDRAGMNIGPDQGQFLAMLVAVTGARVAVEVGTFTGMSALWIAGALPEGGQLTCFDITDEYLPTAEEAWDRAGMRDRVEVRIGPAVDGLAALPTEPFIDFAFVDADKGGYQGYVEALLPRLTERGLIAVDNTLQGGRVADPSAEGGSVPAIRAFNRWVAEHRSLEAVLLAIGDGLTLIRPTPAR